MQKQRRKINLKKEVNKDLHLAAEVPYRIYHHLIGDKFSHSHKLTVGFFVAAFGVIMAKTGHHYGVLVSHLADGVGFLIHGAGVMPYLEYAQKIIKTKYEPNQQSTNQLAINSEEN